MSFDDVFTFYEVQTKSKLFPDHTIGKSTKKRVQRSFPLLLNLPKTLEMNRSKSIFISIYGLKWELVYKTYVALY